MSTAPFVLLRLAGAAVALLAIGVTVFEGVRSTQGTINHFQLALGLVLFLVCVPWSRDERTPPTFKHPLPPLT